MANELIFTSAEAEIITQVSRVVQRDWQRRGFDVGRPVGGAGFYFRGVAKLGLLKVFSDQGFALKTASTYAEAFSHTLAEIVFAKLRGLVAPTRQHAVISLLKNDARVFVCENFAEIDRELSVDGRPVGFDSILMINLGSLAAEMAARIEVVHLDRRTGKLDEKIAAHGE